MIDLKQAEKCEDAKNKKEADFVHKGLRCIVLFVRQSHRCGYVRVPKGHIAYQVGSYDDVPVSVHGGLTFAGEKLPSIKSCGDFMWFGFDCAHAVYVVKKSALNISP